MAKYRNDRPVVDVVCARGHRRIVIEQFVYLDHSHRPFQIGDRESTEADTPRWIVNTMRRLGGGQVADAEGMREWFPDESPALDRWQAHSRSDSQGGIEKVSLDCPKCGLHLPIRWRSLVPDLETVRGSASNWTDGPLTPIPLLWLVKRHTRS